MSAPIDIDLNAPAYTRDLYQYIDEASKPVRLPPKIRTLLAHTLHENVQKSRALQKAHYNDYDVSRKEFTDLPFTKAPKAYKAMARKIIQINTQIRKLDTERALLLERMAHQFEPLRPIHQYLDQVPETVYISRTHEERVAFEQARNASWERLEQARQAYEADFKAAVRELTIEHILKLKKAVTPDTRDRLAHLGQRALQAPSPETETASAL
jgi:hypothetical protein